MNTKGCLSIRVEKEIKIHIGRKQRNANKSEEDKCS
jgi:hypothetical protein